MSEHALSIPQPRIAETQSALRPYLPVLLLLFVGSGAAALIYEIVWFQLLQLAIGSSAVSLGALLGTFMGGMCLGSLLLPRYVSVKHHPLKIYGWIELGIGVCGLLLLLAIPFVDEFYAAIARFGFTGVFTRAIVAALFLLAPTLLMGASLPAIARWISTSNEGVSWLGFFYGGNIAGAVFGCLLAGFYLLRVHDMAYATYVAVAINAGVGAIALLLAGRAPYTAAEAGPEEAVQRTPGARLIYAAIAISGMSALGAEVVWTRVLAMLMGATVYTFSIILAVFLIGLGVGSSAGSFLTRSGVRAANALAWTQMLAAISIGWTAWTLSYWLPNWPVDPALASSPWFNFQIDLVRTFWTVLPPALMWGASFPLAMAAAAAPGQDPGRLAGETYAANTVGAILGAVLFSIVLVPWFGTQGSERILMILAMLAALLAAYGGLKSAQKITLTSVGLIATAVLVVLIARGLGEVPWLALAYGRRTVTITDPGEPLYVGEGMNSSIVISELPAGQRYFHVSGKVEASTEPFDMRLQRMLGHISALANPDPKSVLIVGFGAGVTAGSFTTYDDIEHIVICELEPLIPPAATEYFKAENYDVLHDPRTEIHYDDARHFVLTTQEKFDVITSDPIHPWVKGAATLYSKEYFELAKQHLNPGGVITQWVPLYESDLETVKSEIATFFEVFPNGTIWANNIDGQGYDVVLMGQADPAPFDMDAIQARLDANPKAKESLQYVGIGSAAALFSNYAGRAKDLKPWLEDAQINRDINLRLQYLAGMGVNFQNAPFIMSEILQYEQYPEGLFTGSEETLRELRRRIR